MTEEVFQNYGIYYDLLYRDKDYASEVGYVVKALRNSAPSVRTLLELGAGTGRHGKLLAEQGFEVFGVERSKAMLRASDAAYLAKAATGSFTCVSGDIRTLELGRAFDAAVALFHVVSYQTSNVDVLETFASAARHLSPGGVFLFDVWHGPAVLSERPSTRMKRVEDEKTRLIRIAEPKVDTNASVVTVRYTMLAESKADGRLTTFHEEHRMRYFFPPEIRLLANQSGFEVVGVEEFLTGEPPSERTWGVAYVLRKLNQL